MVDPKEPEMVNLLKGLIVDNNRLHRTSFPAKVNYHLLERQHCPLTIWPDRQIEEGPVCV